MNNRGASSLFQAGPILIMVVGLIALYYLYQYLFAGTTTGTEYPLLKTQQTAKVATAGAITVPSSQLPKLFDGGEFTVSSWFYVNDWSYQSGSNKSILTIGGANAAGNFDTLRIYLGKYKPNLMVRLHSKDTGAVPTSETMGGSEAPMNSLDAATRDAVFTTTMPDPSTLCDLPEIELQRWVNLTVSVNGRTVDVYLDGKLSRSCVLPSYFKVDPSGYTATLLGYGGFGGEIAKTSLYDAALNPERIYKQYMQGPQPTDSLLDWFKSFFQPSTSK